MREWVAVTLAGALGGIAATLFAERVGITSAQSPKRNSVTKADDAQRLALIWNWLVQCGHGFWILLLNAGGGALASFILWATYTSSLNFESLSFTPSEIAAAIIVGLGGVGAVRQFMHEAERADKYHGESKEWEVTAKESMAAARFAAKDILASDEAAMTSVPGENGPETLDAPRA